MCLCVRMVDVYLLVPMCVCEGLCVSLFAQGDVCLLVPVCV